MAHNYHPIRINFYEGSYDPKVLLTTKVVSLVVLSYILFAELVQYGPSVLAFFTLWGVTWSFIYFFLSTLSYVYPYLNKAVFSIYHIIWTFNWPITTIYWSYLFPMMDNTDAIWRTLAHAVPLAATLIDFSISRIILSRWHYLIGIGTLLFYFFAVLMPITLIIYPYTLYPNITFHNGLTFLFLGVAFAIAIVMLELGRLLGLYLEHYSQNKSNLYQHDLTVGLIN
jgi:ABC-type transport system substrate-binding protein